jgi:hypothetical protein
MLGPRLEQSQGKDLHGASFAHPPPRAHHRVRGDVGEEVSHLPRQDFVCGVFVETENLGLRKGQQVHLAFAINLGLVTKIHRRTAIVAHVTRGGTGLMMEQFAGR